MGSKRGIKAPIPPRRGVTVVKGSNSLLAEFGESPECLAGRVTPRRHQSGHYRSRVDPASVDEPVFVAGARKERRWSVCARDRVGAFVVLVPWRRSCRPRKRRDKEVSPRHGRRTRDEPDFGTRAEFRARTKREASLAERRWPLRARAEQGTESNDEP